ACDLCIAVKRMSKFSPACLGAAHIPHESPPLHERMDRAAGASENTRAEIKEISNAAAPSMTWVSLAAYGSSPLVAGTAVAIVLLVFGAVIIAVMLVGMRR